MCMIIISIEVNTKYNPQEGNGYPLQYSGLENSMDGIVHGVTKSQTRLSDFDFDFQVYIFSFKFTKFSMLLT